MPNMIELVKEFIEKQPLLPFKALESKFSPPTETTGTYTDGMIAASAFLDLCKEIDQTMIAYANLVKIDSKKLDGILEGFKASDQ